MRIDGMPALVMHSRPYRESSALVQFFSRNEGRFSAVFKGMRRRRGQTLQTFDLGLVSAVGGSGLMTVTGFELQGRFELSADALSAGFYVLELLSRAVPERQSEQALFDASVDVLTQIQAGARLAPLLRRFEQELLGTLGFGIDYTIVEEHSGLSATGTQIKQMEYEWVPGAGLQPAASTCQAPIDGEILLAMARGDFNHPRVQRQARLLHRLALEPLLGERPLISRSLLSQSGTERHQHD